MSDAEQAPARRMTRVQMIRLALIPVLGFVLYQQTVGRLDAVEEPATAPTTTVVPPGELPPPQTKPSDVAPIRILEEVRDLEKIARENPFAVPETLKPQPVEEPADEVSTAPAVVEDPVAVERKATDERWQQAAARWRAERVSIVFRSGSDLMAVVGDRTVRVGDVVEEGVRVAEIRPDGVILEEVPTVGDESDGG